MRNEIQEFGLRSIEYRQSRVSVSQFAGAGSDDVLQAVFLALQRPMEAMQPHVGLDPGLHLLDLERLRDVVHAARSKRSDLVLALIERAQEDHRDPGQVLV